MLADPFFSVSQPSSSSAYDQELIKSYSSKLMPKRRKERALPPLSFWASYGLVCTSFFSIENSNIYTSHDELIFLFLADNTNKWKSLNNFNNLNYKIKRVAYFSGIESISIFSWFNDF